MQKTAYPLAFGAGFQLRRFTLDHNDLTTAAATQVINLFTLGGKDAIMGVRIQHTTAFTGGGTSTCTVSVDGAVEGVAGFAAAFNIFQAVAATTGQMSQCFKNGSSDGQIVRVTFTSDITCDVVTAGVVNIDILTMSVAAADIA